MNEREKLNTVLKRKKSDSREIKRDLRENISHTHKNKNEDIDSTHRETK